MNLKEPSGEYSPAIFNWYGILERMGYKVSYEDYAHYNPNAFYELVRQTRPDYIFHPTYHNLHTEFARLREYSKVYCIHSDDDWRFDSYIKYWIPFTDGAIGYQNHKEAYLGAGAGDGYYHRARWAFNPNTMHFEFSDKKRYGITHLGGLHGDKAQRIQKLESNGLKIELVDPKFASYSNYMQAYRQSTISICLTPNSLNCAPQSKTRLAEIPYYCVLASEWWPDMEMWNMEPNKDFILIDESQSYIDLINKCLVEEDFANKMYNSAKRILIEKNTVFHEWNSIMKNIDPDYNKIDVNDLVTKFQLL